MQNINANKVPKRSWLLNAQMFSLVLYLSSLLLDVSPPTLVFSAPGAESNSAGEAEFCLGGA
jgi:hypothetical protein